MAERKHGFGTVIAVLLCTAVMLNVGCASQTHDGAGTNNTNESSSAINSFEDCAAAGYPVMESFPRQCRLPDGRTFESEEDRAQINGSQPINTSGDSSFGNETVDDLRGRCCMECREAYSKSPIAAGPHGAQCGHFITGAPISSACEAYFESAPSTVSRCE